MNPFKKIAPLFKKAIYFGIFITVIVTVLFTLGSGEKFAVNTNSVVKQHRDEVQDFVNDKTLNSTKEGRSIILVYRTITCFVNGEACLYSSGSKEKDYNQSVFGFMSNIISYPIATPPASGIYWAQSQLEKVGFIPKSYAAEGIGFAGIRAYQKIWVLFRDMAYIVLVLIISIIGFLIMFRVKINPQTVITLENALPRIIITLVLITFSFAIAGFLIDMMYFLIAVMITQLTQLNIKDFAPSDAVSLINKYSMAKIGDVYNPTDGLWTIGKDFLGILPYMIRTVFQTFFTFFAATWFDKSVLNHYTDKVFHFTENVSGSGGGSVSFAGFGGGVQVGAGLGKFIPAVGNLIISVAVISIIWPFIAPLIVGGIIFLTILFLVFRVFFLVLKVYVTTILLIIFSPMILLAHAIPGKNMFSKWFKSLVANLLVFPMIILLILISSILGSLNASGNTWQPPFVYGINTKSFSTLLALGILLLIPDLVKMLKAMLGAKESPIKFGLGTFFGGAGGIGGTALEQASKFGGIAHLIGQADHLPILKNFIKKKTTT